MESKALQVLTIVHKNMTQNRGTPSSGVPSDTTVCDASRKNQLKDLEEHYCHLTSLKSLLLYQSHITYAIFPFKYF